MAALLKDTPAYTDQLIAWHNQTVFWLAVGLLVLLALSVGDNVSYHLRPVPPPYVLEVNNKGDPVGQVIPVLSVQAIPDAFLRSRLGDFVHDAFSIQRDPDEADYLFNKTQAMVTGQAAQKLDAFYNRDKGKHHPKTAGAYEWADVSVTDTLKLAEKDTFQVDYRTSEHTNNNQIVTTTDWRAVLHVMVGRSADPEALGLFIDTLDLQEVKQ
jgi:type IV secretory pathway TrbF-like protein